MFAVRPLVVAKLLSQLFSVLGVLTIVPLGVSVFAGTEATSLSYLVVIAIFGLMGFAGRFIAEPEVVQTNEALTTVGLVFTCSSVLMAIPIMSYGVGFVDAWFEAVSGVTTTGLSTISLADKPWTFLFARGWMQWVGGIGVVVMALGLLSMSAGAAKALGFSESEIGNTVGGTRAHAKRVVTIYLILTVLGITLLLLCGANLLDAIVHSMAALSTGGFANYSDSLGSLSSAHIMGINLLCIAGAISFHVYYVSILFRSGDQRLDNQLYALVATLTIAILAVWGIGWLTQANLKLLDIVTLLVSAQTTAGFSTTNIAALPAWFIVVLCGAMFVGGGIGSTSGGVKLGRVLFLFSHARLHLLRLAMPPQAYVVKAGRYDEQIQDVLAVVCWFIVILFLSWMMFLIAGYPALTSLFEVTSAVGTAGLTAGVTDSSLPTHLKIVLCIDMLFGRVEVVALLITFTPRNWIGLRRKQRYRKDKT